MSNIPVLRAPTPDDPSSVHYPQPGGGMGPTPPPPAPPAPPAAPSSPSSPSGPEAPSGPTQQQRDGHAYLRSVLQDYGLESLTDWAWQQIVAGNSPTQVLQELRNTPEFRQRFRVIFERERLGLAPMSPAEVIAYEKAARQMMVAAGLPSGFYDQQSDFEGFMIGDVSLSELKARLDDARVWAYQTDAQTRAEMDRLYGAGTGRFLRIEDSMAYYLDPTRALPAIQRQVAAARTSGSALRSGFGGLSLAEAEWLADLGVDPRSAADSFGTLVRSRELFIDLPGGADEGTVSREEQLRAAFGGDAEAQERIERRRRARIAVFGGGGGFATDREGFGGIGTAQ